jgi:hypothetical protein
VKTAYIYPLDQIVSPLHEMSNLALSEVYTIAVPAVGGLGEPLKNETLLKALVKTADVKGNLAVTLAEAQKTTDLILTSANRLYRAYRSFRRGDLKGVAQNLNLSPRTVHKTWLEYKYGWTPLLMEVKGYAEYFAQRNMGERPLRFTVRASVAKPLSYSRNLVMGFFPGVTDHYQTRTVKGTVTGKVKLWLEVTNPNLVQLRELGLTNPLLVAWELVPFSFVFDWFCSVGDWLSGLTALHGLSVKKAMYSTEEDWLLESVIPARSQIVSANSLRVVPRFSWHIKGRHYSRAPISVNPLSLYPPVSSSLGFERLVTSLALMRGNAGRFGR